MSQLRQLLSVPNNNNDVIEVIDDLWEELLSVVAESRQSDVVRTALRTAMKHKEQIPWTAVGRVVSVVYAFKDIAYDALKLCLACGWDDERIAFSVEHVLSNDYCQLAKMEAALLVYVLTPRYPFSTVVPQLVNLCRGVTNDDVIPDDVLMSALCALANIVLHDPQASERVMSTDALAILVPSFQICSRSLFVKDWMATLLALLSQQHSHRHDVIKAGALPLLFSFLSSPFPFSSTQVLALTRVLQKTIMALTRLSHSPGVSAIICAQGALDKIKQLSRDATPNYEHVRMAAENAERTIRDRLEVDQTLKTLY